MDPVYEPMSVEKTKGYSGNPENMAAESLGAKSTVMPLGNSVLLI